MRLTKVAALLLLISIPKPVGAAAQDKAAKAPSQQVAPATPSRVSFPLAEFQFQRAVFSYLTGDRLTLSELGADLVKSSPEHKDKILLFYNLSDKDRLFAKEYPSVGPSTPDTDPLVTKLLATRYRMRRYDDSLEIAKHTVDKGVAAYFEGMSFLRTNRLNEARASLSRIPSDDSLYPYARIAMAQIEVMEQKIPDAEKHLVELLTHPAVKNRPLADKVHLLIGQLFFEKGAYSVAIEQFSKVSSRPLIREAQIGKAWSLIKLGNYEKAVSVLKGIQLSPPYDHYEWETEIILGYCYLKTGKAAQAIDHYQELLNKYVLTEDRVERFIKDEALRQRFRAALLKEDSLQLTEEEEHYLPLLLKDPVISLLMSEHEQLRTLKAAFLKKDREVEKAMTELENKMKMGEALLLDMDRLVVRPKGVLTATNTVIEQRYKMPFFNVTLFSARIFNHWRQVLKKEPTPETKWLVDLILQEFMEEEGLQCLDIPILCHLVKFLNNEKVTETPEQIREIVEVLDILAKDLKSVSRGQKIRFEVIAAGIREKNSAANKGQTALKRLAEAREGIKKSLLEVESGSEKCLSALDRRITQRFTKAKYELIDFREGIIAGLSLAVDVK